MAIRADARAMLDSGQRLSGVNKRRLKAIADARSGRKMINIHWWRWLHTSIRAKANRRRRPKEENSRPDEIRVDRLEPVPARPALVETPHPFRHNAFEAEVAHRL